MPIHPQNPQKNNITNFTNYLEHTLQGNYNPADPTPKTPPLIKDYSMIGVLDKWYSQWYAPNTTFNDIMNSFTGQKKKTAPI